MNLEIFKFMYSFYEENKTLVLVSIASSITRAGLDSIIIPRTLANVFNSLSSENKGTDFSEFRKTLIILIVMWIIMKIIYALSNYCRRMIEPKITEYIINRLVKAVFSKYEAVNELSDVSILINKIHLIKKNLQELFFLIFTVFIPKMIVLVVSLINITIINKEIGGFLTLSILLQCLVIYNNYTECLNTSFAEIESQDKMYEYLEDVFQNINIVQSTNDGYETELKNINNLADEVSHRENISISCVNTQQNHSFFINLIVFIIVLLIIYNFHITNQITNKEVVTIILSVNGMFENIYDFSYYIPELLSRFGVLSSNEEFLQELMVYDEGEDELIKSLELKNNYIIFNKVSFSYKNHVLLNDYSVTLPPNKIIGLFGSSGSGKSTFIKLIFGIITAMEGEIYVGNIPVIKKNCKQIRKYISYMHQNSTSLFDKSLYDNIVYGFSPSDDNRKRIIDLFEKFNLYGIFKNLVKDKEKYSFLYKPVGKGGSNLSGGQKAIVHLLRLDLNDMAKIIILDEVTSALDNNSRDSIIDYIKYLNSKNKTIFIISHDTFFHTIYDIELQFSHVRNPVMKVKSSSSLKN